MNMRTPETRVLSYQKTRVVINSRGYRDTCGGCAVMYRLETEAQYHFHEQTAVILRAF